MLAEFANLGCHHKSAIPLVGVVDKIILVVVLGRPVMLKRQHLGDDVAVVVAPAGGFGNELRCRHLIGLVGVVNAAAVLHACVVALAVQTGRVVDVKKDVQQLAQRNHIAVITDLHHFVKAGVAATYLFVAGSPGLDAVAIAGLDMLDTANPLEYRFGTPETAAA